MDAWMIKVASDLTPGGVGIWFLVVMIAIYMLREWRETRKLSLEDRIARRDGYAKQVETLMHENRDQREDMRLLRREYDEHRKQCQTETDQLRQMVINLESEVQGMKRQRAVDLIEIEHLKGLT